VKRRDIGGRRESVHMHAQASSAEPTLERRQWLVRRAETVALNQ
jgi:hypothetical protein